MTTTSGRDSEATPHGHDCLFIFALFVREATPHYMYICLFMFYSITTYGRGRVATKNKTIKQIYNHRHELR